MNEKNVNGGLRVRSNEQDDLHTLIVTIMAIMPFLPYILSAAVLITVSMCILVFKHSRAAVMRHKRFFTINLAITGISLVSSLLAWNIVGILISYGIFLVLTFATYARTVMTKELFKRVIYISCFGSLVSLATVVFQRIKEPNPNYRPVGLSFNANYLGSVAVLCAVLAIVQFFENDEKGEKGYLLKKILLAASVVANGLIILICESRSSLLAIMGTVFIYFLLRKWYILCGVLAVCGAGVWIIGYFNPDIFGWTNSLTYIFTERVEIWMNAFKSFISGPVQFLIGRGPMTYFLVWEREGLLQANHAHNLLFETLINVGIIGLLFYLALFRSFVRDAFKKKRAGDKTAFILSVVAICEVLIQGIPDVTIMWHQTAVLFVLMVASRFTEGKYE